MALFKRGNVWWFKFVYNGKLYRKTTAQNNKRVAQSLEDEYKVALRRAEIGLAERTAPPFDKAMSEYLEWKERMLKRKTFLLARTCSVRLKAHFGNRKLNTISVNDVLEYQRVRSEEKRQNTSRNISPVMVNRELGLMRAMYRYWQRQGLRLENPVSLVKLAAEDTEVFVVVSQADEELYLSVASKTLKDVATLILQTAMRPGEVFALRKKNVNLQQGWLQVEAGKTRSARRKLYLTNEAKRVIAPRMLGLSPWVFPQAEDPEKHIVNLTKVHITALRKASEKAKKPVKFRIYDLRHTAATRLAEAGVDLVTLAGILGHSKVQMVFRYAHPVERSKAEAMMLLSQGGHKSRHSQADPVKGSR